MMVIISKIKGFIRRHRVLSVFVLIFALIFFILPWTIDLIKTPNKLGPELEYVGSWKSGCPWWLPMPCADKERTYYYFATNLNDEDLKDYFDKKNYEDSIPSARPQFDGYASETIYFNTPKGKFWLEYHDSAKTAEYMYALRHTGKAHVVSIHDVQYDLAKSALAD